MTANSSSTRLWCILGFLCVLCLAEDTPSRKLRIYLNPGCSFQNCTSNDTTLVYVEAKGSNDTIHYLWSNIGRPTALIVQTDSQAVLDVDWERLLSNDSQTAIHFSSDPLYSMAFVVQKLWQFDDVNDTADVNDMTNSSLVSFNDFSSVTWSDVNASLSCSKSHCSATFLVLPDNETISQDGKMSLQFTASGILGRATTLPHLQLSPESTQLELLFDNMVLESDHSRFALEVMFFATEPRVTVDEKPHMETSMDDEYTPGVFTQGKFQTPLSKNESNRGSYLYWKPVSYIKPERTVIFSTDVTVGTVSNSSETPLPHSIAQSFFNPPDTLLLMSNISFGSNGDGFFTKTNYSSWALVIGLGQPPAEKLSTMVILIISIGLGAPLILMIVGSVYMVGRKLFKKKDELLLSRDVAT